MRTPRSNRRQLRKYVTDRKPFIGSNTRGVQIGDSYVAYSYAAPIFIWAAGIWFANSTRYSATTSAHKGYMRPFRDEWIELIDLPAERMADLHSALLNGQPAEAVVAELLIRCLPTP